MRKIYTLLAALLLYNPAWTQNENNVWIFGNEARIDFTGGVPAFSGNTLPDFFSEAIACISDADGNFLFATNGEKIYDQDYSVMPNGSDLVPAANSYSSTQGAAIARRPGYEDQYYVFSLESSTSITTSGRLSYSLIDMNLNGGKGDVVTSTKSVLIDSQLNEKMTLVKGDCSNIWLVAHSRLAHQFRVFEITGEGISTTPVLSTFSATPESGFASGVIKISPDRTKLALIRAQFMGMLDTELSTVELYDFNPANGTVNNRRILDTPLNGNMYYGACFSPDNTKLYASTTWGSINIFQFDVTLPTTAAIAASKTLIHSEPYGLTGIGYSDLKMGPDNRIYAGIIAANRIDRIDQPNEPGTLCSFTTSAGTFPVGVYPYLGMPNDIAIAEDSIATFSNIHATCSSLTSISGRTGAAGYSWSTGANTYSIEGAVGEIYWVKSRFCGYSIIDTIKLDRDLIAAPLIDIDDITVCPGSDPVTLVPEYAGLNNPTFEWFPASAIVGANDRPDVKVNTNMTDYLIIKCTNHSGDLCEAAATDTIKISYYDIEPAGIASNDTLICAGSTIRLSAFGPDGAVYNWCLLESGKHLEDEKDILQDIYADAGIILKVTHFNECVTSDTVLIRTEPCCYVSIPNAFSPNGDGLNDVFRVAKNADQDILDFSIYNRYGNLVWKGYSFNEGWDGTIEGNKAEAGVYYYNIRYKCYGDLNTIYREKGDITLIR